MKPLYSEPGQAEEWYDQWIWLIASIIIPPVFAYAIARTSLISMVGKITLALAVLAYIAYVFMTDPKFQ